LQHIRHTIQNFSSFLVANATNVRQIPARIGLPGW
jgi:hypothetical protein